MALNHTHASKDRAKLAKYKYSVKCSCGVTNVGDPSVHARIPHGNQCSGLRVHDGTKEVWSTSQLPVSLIIIHFNPYKTVTA